MKIIVRFFRSFGDIIGLAILLGGLLLATNNVARKPPSTGHRRAEPVKPAATMAGQGARAAA